jgi:hypothetical protein
VLNKDLAALDEQRKKVELLLNKMSCDLPLPKTEATADDKTLEQPNENVCNKLRYTLQGLVDQQKVLRRSVADLQVQFADSASAGASIFASKSIRAGVTLRIKGVQRKFTSSDAGGTFKLHEGTISRVE